MECQPSKRFKQFAAYAPAPLKRTSSSMPCLNTTGDCTAENPENAEDSRIPRSHGEHGVLMLAALRRAVESFLKNKEMTQRFAKRSIRTGKFASNVCVFFLSAVSASFAVQRNRSVSSVPPW